jgi:hypothetical protein
VGPTVSNDRSSQTGGASSLALASAVRLTLDPGRRLIAAAGPRARGRMRSGGSPRHDSERTYWRAEVASDAALRRPVATPVTLRRPPFVWSGGGGAAANGWRAERTGWSGGAGLGCGGAVVERPTVVRWW